MGQMLLHREQMAPAQQVRVLRGRIDRLQPTGYYQRADVEETRVRVGRAAGEVPEPAVRVAARQRPLRDLLQCRFRFRLVATELTHDERRVERRILEWQASIR